MGQSSADLDLGILLPSAIQVLGVKQGVNDRYTIQYISGLLDFILPPFENPVVMTPADHPAFFSSRAAAAEEELPSILTMVHLGDLCHIFSVTNPHFHFFVRDFAISSTQNF